MEASSRGVIGLKLLESGVGEVGIGAQVGMVRACSMRMEGVCRRSRGRGMGGNGSALDRQERRIVPGWRGKERIQSRRSIFALCGSRKSRPRMRSTDMLSMMKRAVGMRI